MLKDVPRIERSFRTIEPPDFEDEPAPIIFYAGERIDFRPIELSDEPLLRRWINDPRVWATLHFRGPLNTRCEVEYIESLYRQPNDYTFGIIERETSRLVGTCGLHGINPISRKATFGLMIGEVGRQNRGLGSEAVRLALKFAFRELNLHRVELSVFANNWRAIRAYQKAGYRHEGCRRQAAFRDGEYIDVYEFGILREEWDVLPTSAPASFGRLRSGGEQRKERF